MHIKEISSPQNQLIKDLSLLLTKSRSRRERGLFLVEGLREVERALRAGYRFESVLYRPDLISMIEVDERLSEATHESHTIQHIQCAPKVFSKVAYRTDVPNIVGVAQRNNSQQLERLEAIISRESAQFILVLEGVEKPGNLGAILRSADAFGVDAVILVDSTAEVEHPNTLRNSLGAALALPIASLDLETCHRFLRDREIPIYVTHLNAASKPPNELPLTESCALVLGSEAKGVRDLWFELGAQATLIPMTSNRVVDSLNVSVAAAIMLYEVSRQRRSTVESLASVR